MTQDTPSFFTLDRGTSTTSAALVAPVDGRYRLLAAGTAPAEADVEAILMDLAWRVARTDPSIAGPMDRWRDWSRLEVRTTTPSGACLVAATEETGRDLERAFTDAGWRINARFYGPEPDLIALGEACLDPLVDAVVVGRAADAREDEHEQLRFLWPRCGAIARFRDDLAVVACGSFSERPEGLPDTRLFSLPAPEAVVSGTNTTLRQAARQVGSHLQGMNADTFLDAHETMRTSVASLAALLEGRVEAIGVGSVAGSRTLARPGRDIRHSVLAAGALLPRSVRDDVAQLESILRWCSLSSGSVSLRDRLRELSLRPWASHEHDDVRLRLASLRAALERMQAAWTSTSTSVSAAEASDTPDPAGVVVISGGAFSAVPTALAALAVVDSTRRPGAMTIRHDHARVLAPLGALPIEEDRRRLLADLMDDILLPAGSALLTGPLASGRASAARVEVSTPLGDQEITLEPGQLRFVDLPPGIAATVEVEADAGAVSGADRGPLTAEVSGGLGGLLLDTRDIPLRLPESAEERQSLLAAWEAPAWAGSER